MVAGIQPAELGRKASTLPLARRAMEPRHLLQSALTHSPGGNAHLDRDTHLYPPHNNSSVDLTTTTEVLRSGQITMECGVVEDHYKTPYFHPRHRHPPSWNDPAKNSMGAA